MNYKISVNWEEIESIIKQELLKDYKYCLHDLASIKSSGKGFVYSKDAKEDEKRVKELADNLAGVLKYYGLDVKDPDFESSIEVE